MLAPRQGAGMAVKPVEQLFLKGHGTMIAYRLRLCYNEAMRLALEIKKEEWLALALTVTGIALRLLPHPDNFTPVMAIALFAGVTLPAGLALTVPITIMIATDLVIGPHPLYFLTWGSFFLVGLLGASLKSGSGAPRIVLGSLAGSLLFFIVTNLGVFLFQDFYPKNWNGLCQCYLMALPFFRNALLGDLFFTAILFGAFALLKTLTFPLAVKKS